MRKLQIILGAVAFILSNLAISSSLAYAGGSKEAKANPVIIPDEGCTVLVPEQIDITACVVTGAPDQSGIQGYFCTIKVECDTE